MAAAGSARKVAARSSGRLVVVPVAGSVSFPVEVVVAAAGSSRAVVARSSRFLPAAVVPSSLWVSAAACGSSFPVVAPSAVAPACCSSPAVVGPAVNCRGDPGGPPAPGCPPSESRFQVVDVVGGGASRGSRPVFSSSSVGAGLVLVVVEVVAACCSPLRDPAARSSCTAWRRAAASPVRPPRRRRGASRRKSRSPWRKPARKPRAAAASSPPASKTRFRPAAVRAFLSVAAAVSQRHRAARAALPRPASKAAVLSSVKPRLLWATPVAGCGNIASAKPPTSCAASERGRAEPRPTSSTAPSTISWKSRKCRSAASRSRGSEESSKRSTRAEGPRRAAPAPVAAATLARS